MLLGVSCSLSVMLVVCALALCASCWESYPNCGYFPTHERLRKPELFVMVVVALPLFVDSHSHSPYDAAPCGTTPRMHRHSLSWLSVSMWVLFNFCATQAKNNTFLLDKHSLTWE